MFKPARTIASAYIALTFIFLSGVAFAEEAQPNCAAITFDLTDPETLKITTGASSVSQGVTTERFAADGTKTSIFEGALWLDDARKEVGTKITCTSACVGSGCSIRGCDAWLTGCSPCYCFGINCPSCTCIKKIEIEGAAPTQL